MSITTYFIDDTNELVIELEGAVDFNLAEALRDAYTEYPAGSYILDMIAVDNIDSSSLGLLLNMRKSINSETPITIRNCQPRVLKILKLAQFDRKFLITKNTT